MIKTDFEKTLNSEGLTFTNKDIIDKQRAVVGYLIKKVGINILTGKSIMKVSLPINIFDVRSHLEVYVYQNSYTSFIEEAAKTEDKLERLKLVIRINIDCYLCANYCASRCRSAEAIQPHTR
jgi:hypothetical protein